MAKRIKYDIYSLIEVIESKECLWDKTKEVSKDKILRRNAWRDVYAFLEPNFEDMDQKSKDEIKLFFGTVKIDFHNVFKGAASSLKDINWSLLFKLSFKAFSLDETEAPTGILYIPDSDAAYRLIVEVTEMLNQFSSTKKMSKRIRSMSFPNATSAVEALILLTNQTKYIYALVEFHDFDEKELPNVLKYTIRMSALYLKQPTVRFQRLFEKFENVPQSFLPLQWAIDRSYIKLKSENSDLVHMPKVIQRKWCELFRPFVVQANFQAIVTQLNRTFTFFKVNFQPLSDEGPKWTLNKTFISTVFFLLSYVSFGAPMLPFIFLMNRLLEERATGIQELVKMVGVTPPMLALTQLLNSLPACLIYCIGGVILLKSSSSPMVPYSNPVILFIGQFLHFMTIFSMAFACSNLSSDVQHSISMSVLLYIGLWIPIKLLEAQSKYDWLLFFVGLFPHCPAYWFLNEALVAEIRYEIGLQASNLTDRFSVYPNGAKNGCVLAAFGMQLTQIILFSFIAWYLGSVKPGKYGIPKPWNFLCTKDYWKDITLIPQEPLQDTVPYDPAYQKYFEDPPTNMDAGIRINRVSKIFNEDTKKEFKALSDVTLNVYKGEITVLLGHNGAGKTTLISIITGMIKQTAGKIYVNGKDTVTQQDEVRRQLGFCPQHNLFFPDLTVLEHLMFFSLIKGGSFKDAKISSVSLMKQLDLEAFSHRRISELSGGMLRRLQLGCALCGDASVLILDEPTSGLDVEARRELWDTLLNLRGDRTLVLTTHFMEEADVLGDRIAALHLGKLRCHATPMFLKKAVGSGFRINISTVHEHIEDKITPVIMNLEPNAILNDASVKSLVYVLPAGANVRPIFKTLEDKKQELDIESMGVGVTSLEEVFLELCCDVDTNKSGFAIERDPAEFKYITGCRRLCRHIKELLKRQVDFTLNNIVAFILLHIVLPYVLCTSLTQIFNVMDQETNANLKLDLDMYSETNFKSALINFRRSDNNTNKIERLSKSLSHMKLQYPNYYFHDVWDFPYVHSMDIAGRSGGIDTHLDLSKYMAGIDMNDTAATILYSRSLKHSAPVGLNMFSNILAIQNLPNAHGRTIVTMLSNNWPVSTKPYHIPKTKVNCSLFAIFNICTLLATTVNDMSLPCKERATVARHTHIMAGSSPFLYWLITFLYHMFFFMTFACSATLVAAAFFDNDRTIDDKATLKAILLVITMSGMNNYAFMYFVSFVWEERPASLIIVSMTMVFGFLLPVIIIGVEDIKTVPEETMLSRVTNIIGLFIPTYMFTKAFIEVTTVSRFNSYCIHNLDKCPNLRYYAEGFSNDVCCQSPPLKEGPFSHFAINSFAAGKSLIIIAIQIISFWTLVFLFQYGTFNLWWNKLGTCKATYPQKKFDDPNVKTEEEYVITEIAKGKSKMKHTMLMENAWKVYRSILWGKTYALKGATFSVKNGECFGILGLNGAGKTTTFKLISKEESLTKGKILVNGHRFGGQYLRSLGYCPQFCGLDDFRSGQANLRMLLVLRGLSNEDVKLEMATWLEVVGMTQHAHREVSGYSGGMIRRLATAASLCSGAPLTLLDEPTAGVDTAARRLVWAALQKGVKHDRAIAISSHCMDEMERLCKRVTILTLGEMSVLGTPQALKDQYARGHTIVFKLRADMAQSLRGQEQITHLKQTLNRQFNCSMKDKHLTSLHYRINDKLPYSEIFTKMESIMQEYSDLVEDYSERFQAPWLRVVGQWGSLHVIMELDTALKYRVSDTTLEDVFLTFAVQAEKSTPSS